MYYDKERETYLDLAERVLLVYDLNEVMEDNDLTEEDVLSYLIELGLINCELFGGKSKI